MSRTPVADFWQLQPHQWKENTLDQQRLRPENSEVLRLKCDNTKLKKATEFVPSIPLRDGLERTFRWFLEPSNLRRYKGDLYNV